MLTFSCKSAPSWVAGDARIRIRRQTFALGYQVENFTGRREVNPQSGIRRFIDEISFVDDPDIGRDTDERGHVGA